MEDYLSKFNRIKPIFDVNYEMINILKFLWDNIKQYELHEHASILTDNHAIELFCPSPYNGEFLNLELSKSGDCVKIKYVHPYNDTLLFIYVNNKNKIQAVKSCTINAYNNSTNTTLIDLFYGNHNVKFFHIIIPNDEVPEVLFQLSTVYEPDLSFIQEFL